MPLRPSLFLRPTAPRPTPWPHIPPSQHRTRPSHSSFHTTTPLQSNDPPNHYETLHLPPSASPADIKRQFYALSKQHHPDRNPNDPTASTRFVQISEAYHTLSVPEKRAQYDAQTARSERRAGTSHPQGSYSSAAYGSRPASGLNKKRSTFRGPPPSFYKAGGYGRHGAKRAEYAYHDAHTEGKEKAAPEESYGDFGSGFGPGQQKQGHEVPHFDDRRHKETHDSVNEFIYARRRRAARGVGVEEEYGEGGMLLNFILVSGVVGMIGMTAVFFGSRHEAKQGTHKDDG